MRILRALALATLLAAVGFVVWAAWPTADDRLVFRMFGRPARGVGLFVRFGLIANAARDYPTSFYATYLKQCSGTMVGRDTILISAHCLHGAGRVEIQGGLGRLAADCQPHPDYSVPPAHDVALCKIDGTAPITNGFEQIARPPYRLSSTDVISLTGWGSDDSGFFRALWTRVKFTIGAGGDFRVGKATGTDEGATITAIGEMTAGGRVALDQGDSGGAAYVGPDEKRRIVGTNSCGGEKCGRPKSEIIALANLLEEKTVRFIEEWARTYNAHICGIDPSKDAGCHK